LRSWLGPGGRGRGAGAAGACGPGWRDGGDCDGEWTYEVACAGQRLDVYEQALSWTPFLASGHARAAGRALAKLHIATKGYDAPARGMRPLVSSFTIFAGIDVGDDPVTRMEGYLASRPCLQEYAEVAQLASGIS